MTETLMPGVEPVPGYRLVERLGRGGFGEVWKALGPGGVPVALKVVALEGGGEVEQRALGVIKAIRHPHLLPVFGIWQRGDRLIVAMELGERTLLDRYKEAVGQGFAGIPAPEIHEHFADAARGLDYLNEPRHGSSDGSGAMAVQHRDIKPQNILLVGGCAKVADFGLARALEGSTSGHSGGMTPTYAAPEFFAGRTSSQSDQYSLAVTYCHLRGGRPPFTGSIEEVMNGHVSRPPDLSMLPESERPAVARALAKDPKDRWPSCRAFVEALHHGGSTTTNLPHDHRRPAPRRRPPVALIAVAALLLAVGLGALIRFWPGSNDVRRPIGPGDGDPAAVLEGGPTPPGPREGDGAGEPGPWAMEFDGSRDEVRTDYRYNGQYPVTFEAVVTPGSASRGPIVGNFRVGDQPRTGRGISLSIGPNGHFGMLFGSGERPTVAAAESPVELGRRVHLAGRFDPRSRKVELYVDGVLKAGAGPGPEYKPIPQALLIGSLYSRSPVLASSFSGRIEWVRVSRVLRRFDGGPVPMGPPEPDDDTVLLVDFTGGESRPPLVVPAGGRLEIDGPRWVRMGAD